jgi:hypothetical protein
MLKTLFDKITARLFEDKTSFSVSFSPTESIYIGLTIRNTGQTIRLSSHKNSNKYFMDLVVEKNTQIEELYTKFETEYEKHQYHGYSSDY